MAQPLLRDAPEAFLLVDDSVRDKRYIRFIDVAKRPYPDNAPGMVTGIRLVNLVQGSGKRAIFCPWFSAPGLPRLRARTGRAAEKRPFPGHV